MLITTSLFDNRVLYSEPVKYIAKLRDVKKCVKSNYSFVRKKEALNAYHNGSTMEQVINLSILNSFLWTPL